MHHGKMDMNDKFLKEAEEIEKRWKKTGLLDGLIPDKDNKATTAVLLENQRLINEQNTDTRDLAKFKRITIPLVRRLYPTLDGIYPSEVRASPAPVLKQPKFRSIDADWEDGTNADRDS